MIMPMMQFPILPTPKCMMHSPKHCKMAATVAHNILPLEPNQSKERRFAQLSEEERNVKKKNVIPGNTQRAKYICMYIYIYIYIYTYI